ncbi:MAG: hypothetical protein KTR31_25310 [Myxococcales bacterium]|nr:hypothetical protein [Myxococcales bacterium]
MSPLAAWLAVAPGWAQVASPQDSCYGVLDYADELHPDAGAVRVTQVALPDDRVQLTVSGLHLDNVGIARFDRATALPQLDDTATLVHPAEFGQALPGLTATADDALVVELPADEASTWVADLKAGTLPFVLHADEDPQLEADAQVFTWTEQLDDAYGLASVLDATVNPDPGPGPWAQGSSLSLTFAFDGDVPDALTDYDLHWTRLIVPHATFAPVHLPQAAQHLSVDTIDTDDTGAFTLVTVVGHLSDEVDLTQVYRAASLCSGSRGHVDWPVRQTRLYEIGGDEVDPDTRDRNSQPIRFNDTELLDGRVTLTGQVHADLLKPSFGVRIRDGALHARADFVSEVSMSAQLGVLKTVEDHEEIELWQLDFPLPDFTLGGMAMAQHMSLEHYVYADVALRAGAVVGVSKRISARLSVDCEFPLDEAPSCTTERSEAPSDVLDLSPPQLLHDVGGTAEVGTRLDTSWVVGTRTIPQLVATRLTLSTEGYGLLDVQLGRDPWWTVGHGARLEGTAALEFFGSPLAEHTVDLWESPVHIDAQAPPVVSSAAAPPQRFLSGEDLRWLVSTDIPTSDVNHPQTVDLAVLDDGGVVAAVAGSKSHRILRFDRHGVLLWAQRYLDGYKPRAVTVLPSGNIAVSGVPTFLAVHAPDGTVLWSTAYDLDDADGNGNCSLNDMAHRPEVGSDGQLVLVGRFTTALVSQDDACALLVDASDGTVQWSRIYGSDWRQELHGVTVLSDGDIVAVGYNGWRHPDHLNAGANGWLMRLDPSDGTTRWNRITPTVNRGGQLEAVAEGPNGRLLAVGSSSRLAPDTGSAFLVAIDANGGNAVHGIFLHDALHDQILDFETPQQVISSDTPNDTIRDVTTVQDGFVVAGHSSNRGHTGWVAKISPQLGVDWFMALDGDGDTAVTSIARTDQGLAIGGFSKSAAAGGAVLTTEEHVVVAHLPFEGKLAVHRHFPWLQTPMLSPGMRGSSIDPTIAVLGAVYEVTGVTATSPATVAGADPVDLTLPAEPECVLLMTQTGRPTPQTGCPEQPDVWSPIVRITSPDRPSYGWSEQAVLTVTVADEDGVQSQTIEVDGASASDGDVLVMAVLGVGEHEAVATATDASGNEGQDSVHFVVVDDEPPAVDIVSPEARSYDRDVSPVIDVVVTSSDQATEVDRVEVTLDGVPVPGDTIRTGDLPPNQPLKLVATATDRQGNVAVDTVTFQITGPGESGSEGNDGRGCGCSQGTAPLSLALPLLALLALRRLPRGRRQIR